MPARHVADDLLGQLDLALRRGAEGQTIARCLGHRVKYSGVAVAEDHRAPGTDVVDVALVLCVPHVGADGAGDEARGTANGAEGAHRRVHTARNDPLGALEQ
jgi:hypothetical protein